MAVFTPGTPIETTDPTITVEGLPVGTHTFSLTVVDEEGNASAPNLATVTVQEPVIVPRVITVHKIQNPVDADHDPVAKEIWVSGGSRETGGAFLTVVPLSEPHIAASVPISFAGDIAVPRPGDLRVGIVGNPGNRSVTFFSLPKRGVLKVVQLKDNPDGVAITPDGTLGLAVIPLTGQVVIFDLSTFAPVAEISVGRLPSKVTVSPTGRIAFINCQGDGNVVGVDLKKLAVAGKLPVGGVASSKPMHMTVASANFPVWSANAGNNTASLALSPANVQNVKLEFSPGGVAADAVGKSAFLAGPASDILSKVDQTGLAVHSVQMPAPGAGVEGVATTKDGAVVMVAHPQKAIVSIFRGSDLHRQAVISGFKGPNRVITCDDDSFFCVLDGAGDSISLVDRQSLI